MKKHTRARDILAALLSCILFVTPFGVVFADTQHDVKISVIIPVYNVERDLDKSLTTVENQTFKDIEIICVNDGSSDGSLDILKEHAQKDSRIKIIDQENQGASEARNVGLREAKGEYIYFCDGDDYVLPYTLEKALGMFEKYGNLDAVEFGVHRVNYKREVNLGDYEYRENDDELLECAEGESPYEVFKTFGWGVWKYLYKKSFLVDNGLEFKKGLRTNEDVLFGFLAMARMKRVCRDKNIGYVYRVRRYDSTTNTICKVHKKQLEGFIEIANEIISNRPSFNFAGSDGYILNFILSIIYKRVKNIEDNKERTEYAKIVCRDILENFAEKYKVDTDELNKQRIIDLNYWAEGLEPEKVIETVEVGKNNKIEKPKKTVKAAKTEHTVPAVNIAKTSKTVKAAKKPKPRKTSKTVKSVKTAETKKTSKIRKINGSGRYAVKRKHKKF